MNNDYIKEYNDFTHSFKDLKDNPQEKELENLLDKMMDYLDKPRFCWLFDQICDYFNNQYPHVITEAIIMYHYIWDNDDQSDSFTDLF